MPNGPPLQVCASSAGSELSRQVPVDLKPQADLNEGRGCPGHCLSSLAFQSSNKLDRGTPSRKPPQQHWRTHTYSAKEFYYRPPQGLPVITPAPYHCAGKAIRMPRGTDHVVKSLNASRLQGCLLIPLRDALMVPDITGRVAIISVVSIFLSLPAGAGRIFWGRPRSVA